MHSFSWDLYNLVFVAERLPEIQNVIDSARDSKCNLSFAMSLNTSSV